MSRAAAYGELVAGILDVRDAAPTRRFDDAVREAVAAGRLDPRTAAELRWLQRESLQALVEHARTALPAALLGIDDARAASPAHDPEPAPAPAGALDDRTDSLDGTEGPATAPARHEAAPAPHRVWATVALRHETPGPSTARGGAASAAGPGPQTAAGAPGVPPAAEPTESTEEPAVRRLLVAGLTSLTGPTLHG